MSGTDTPWSSLPAGTSVALTDELIVSRPTDAVATRQKRVPINVPGGLEHQARLGQPNGYTGLDPNALVPRAHLRPELVVYPEDYGAGTTSDDTSAIVQAIAAAQTIGGQVYFSRKQYNIVTGNIAVSNVTLRGCGVLDSGSPYGNSGSVIAVTGTTNPAFVVGYGATFEHLAFWYPNQTEAACAANGGVPIVYPALFEGLTCSRSAWRFCIFVGAYYIWELGGAAAGQTCGGNWIVDCMGYAVAGVASIKSMAETSYMSRCHWSWGWDQGNVLAGQTFTLRDWSANNGSGIVIDTAGGNYTSVDALQITDTYFFGHFVSIHVVSGQAYNLQVTGCGFESVATIFQVEAAANVAYGRFQGCFFSTTNVARPTQAETAFLLRSTGVNNLLAVNDCTFGSLTGNCIDVGNQSGTGETVLNISGNTFHGWGLQLDPSSEASYAISITAANLAMTISGNIFNSAAPNQGVAINVASVADGTINGNTIRNCFLPIEVTAAGELSIVGNTIANTTGGTSIALAAQLQSAANVVVVGNACDKAVNT